jgi:hypothetical protein
VVCKIKKLIYMVFLLIALLSFLLQFFLPWWIIAVVAFGVALWKASSGGNAFLSGFLAIVLVWTVMAGFIHIHTEGILSNKIAALFYLPSPLLLIIITAFIGGLVGGMAALSGFFVRKLFERIN